jgi:hypothetical protein
LIAILSPDIVLALFFFAQIFVIDHTGYPLTIAGNFRSGYPLNTGAKSPASG